MDPRWTHRDYKNGDELPILRLFKQVFGQEMSLSFWRWRFKENPYGKGIIKLMFDVDKLIGQYAVVPVSVQVADSPVKAVFSMTTMTHPDYSGRGIFTFLAEKVYRSCAQHGFSFVYGFPNDNSYPGFTLKLDWEGLGKTVTLQKSLPEKLGNRPKAANIKNVERFDETVDLLWDKVKNEYPVAVPRVEKYLNWRFSRNPDVRYQKYVISERPGRIAGYTVLKEYVRGDEKIGHIVDMLSVNRDDIIRMLVRHACAYFKSRQISDVSGWFPVNSRYCRVMEEEGFEEVRPGQNFGIRVFDKAGSLAGTAGSMDNWYLTMGDSDVF
jgi:GNAT superfamily N-acetyltransferase